MASNHNSYAKRPAGVTFTPAAGSSNVSEVTLQVIDRNGRPIASVFNIDVYLSDSANGDGLTTVTASGAVAVKASNGADLGTIQAKKFLRSQTTTAGKYVLSITDTAKTAFVVCVAGIGRANQLSDALVTANYG